MSTDNKKKNIVIIDDDPAVLNSIVRQLSREENLNLMPENNPENALVRIESEPVDLVVCDIKMEPVNGLKVLKTIKDKYPALPVIIATGFVDDAVMEKARNFGCDTFFIKPVRKKDLIKAVQDLLE